MEIHLIQYFRLQLQSVRNHKINTTIDPDGQSCGKEAIDSDMERRIKTSKLGTLELIADQIIELATVKEQPRFIDEDQPEDNVSYEESKTMEEHHRFEISCQNKFLGN